MDKKVADAMAQPADQTLDELARPAARRAAIAAGVKGDVVAEKEIYRAIIAVANGYAASRT